MIYLLLVLSFLWASPALAANLTHGPMLGAVQPGSAMVWARTNAPAVVHGEWSLLGDFSDAVAGELIVTASASDYTAAIHLAGFPNQALVFYRVFVDWAPEVAHSFRSLPSPGSPGVIRILVYSDWAKSDNFPGLATGLVLNPDYVFFSGDLPHPHDNKVPTMRATQRGLRDTSTALGRDIKVGLIDAVHQFPLDHHLSDHDSAGDDSNRLSPAMPAARQVFFEHWPSLPTDLPGAIYKKRSIGMVDLFILDTRTLRDPKTKRDGPDKTMLGAEQKAWLFEGLLASTATHKLLISDVVWNPSSKINDTWGSWLWEQAEIAGFIMTNGIKNVYIASGDRHAGGLDDGTNTLGLPEANAPAANNCGLATGKKGTWTHGVDGTGAGPTLGFVDAVFTDTQATFSIVNENGVPRFTMTIPVAATGEGQ